jgi:hypothetical protein
MLNLESAQTHQGKAWGKALAAVVGTSVLLAVLVIAFALPASRSGPHNLPIGVVGSSAQVDAFHSGATSFAVSDFGSADDARQAIEHRQIYGAVVLNSPTHVDVLVATAASPTAAALVQALGQHIAQSTHRSVHIDDVRGFPNRDSKGVGLAAGAFPMAIGGFIGAMVIMMLIPRPAGRILAAIGFAVMGGLTIVGTLQFVIGTFDGNFWMTSLAGMLGIAATCFTVLGLREVLGSAGLGIAAVLLVLLGNPLSGLASAPEMLPTPWGTIGQLLPPGATGTLMRDVAFFDGYGTAKPLLTLTCYLIAGAILYAFGVARARRTGTIDVDRIEFDHLSLARTEPITALRTPAPPATPR